MLPKGFQWQQQSSSWDSESWLVANGQPVGIVSALENTCYLSHPSNTGLGWTTERANSPEEAIAALERWAMANVRRRWLPARGNAWRAQG